MPGKSSSSRSSSLKTPEERIIKQKQVDRRKQLNLLQENKFRLATFGIAESIKEIIKERDIKIKTPENLRNLDISEGEINKIFDDYETNMKHVPLDKDYRKVVDKTVRSWLGRKSIKFREIETDLDRILKSSRDIDMK